ncbi:MAG TPA: glutamate synthase large subunit [Chloroflexota bacterium]
MSNDNLSSRTQHSLYDPRFEHDACGVGFVADVSGRPSHAVIAYAIESVINVTHRGAVSADGKSGDGAGIMTQIPRRLLRREVERLGYRVSPDDAFAVGMVFFPRDASARARCQRAVEEALDRHGLDLLTWRAVPVDPSVLGDKARRTQPDIQQAIVPKPAGLSAAAFERTLYLVRKDIERFAAAHGVQDLYVPSFSHRTVVYKGLFVAPQLSAFYTDLRDPEYESALAVFHQRYSTNTFPNWFLAQPFRMLAHNGEINTLQGNRNWMRAREPELESPVWGDEIAKLLPIIWEEGSDSASLDNALELLALSGRDILHAMMMLVPEAWENMPNMDPLWRSFYEYHASLSEPWDGPAALAFTDGTIVAAALDRNGLRPARYKITTRGLVVVASEVGTIDIPEEEIAEKGRLGPGQMIAVDTASQRILKNEEIKTEVASRQPYGEWVTRQVYRLAASVEVSNGKQTDPEDAALLRQQRLFGYTNEDVKFIVQPMGADGKEPVWSMGDDAPLAVLSTKPRSLYHYFKQRFAQVTNPPIDPLREELVMSLNVYLGARRSFLVESEEHAHLVHLSSPVLLNQELDALRSIEDPAFRTITLPMLFPAGEGAEGLDRALDALCAAAVRAVDEGHHILVLSDRGADASNAPIPALLAVGAVHHHLIRQGRRMRADIVVETGEAWEVHQFALLIGYGASAVNPYLALETARSLEGSRGLENLDAAALVKNFVKAVEAGILKIMSKMGISTLSSYRGAQIFEALGLSQELIDRAFVGTPSRIGGIGLREVAAEVLRLHVEAFGEDSEAKLKDYGFIRYRRDGEYHAFNPHVVRAMHRAVENDSYEAYKVFSELADQREPATLRDLLRLRSRGPIPIDEVEPVERIRQRFISTAMSLGALSPEAHTTLAIAMNRIGAKSNCGEGGEDPDWYDPQPNGDVLHNKIKQVASGRFGVTTLYLAMADELEIKMAQGSKPGEGGQLPGHKVTEMIARFRHAVPGIQLISPPPHHDIYSIEDLAQLIYDLKQVNPRAKVGVKLVAETGVGTIAAGVAKAYADYILISGHSGGTGASPLSSIKGAGCPWELGLAETQQVLVLNDLRGRVRLRTDGGLKTGRDIVIAALLGAEEFGFGTAAVVAIGCDMARQCHLNTCPTGIATQREDLRRKFTGRPEMMIAYCTMLAQEVREILAWLGFRSLDEIVGRVDLLEQVPAVDHPKANTLDLRAVLADVDPEGTRPRRCVQPRNDRPGDAPLDERIIRDAAAALERGEPVALSYPIRNSNRSVGTRLAGAVAYRYRRQKLPEGTITITFHGSAGQSFGAFVTDGMRLVLEGEANDYVGKGLSGGEIIVRPPSGATYPTHKNVIMGNTVLYGATGGALFAAGRAGERFAVRNSGALAVVEGTGDHCCEYMTAGVVVVLGPTGRNFGAGMSNGVAFVLDEEGDFLLKYNPELVVPQRLADEADIALLRSMVEAHLAKTNSPRAREVLDRWDHYLPLFWKVAPKATPKPVAATETVAQVTTSANGAAAPAVESHSKARQ